MDSMSFVLFGATGDLAKRKIFPALFNLFSEGKLPKSFQIIALGRKEIPHKDFRKKVSDFLKEFSRVSPDDDNTLDLFLNTIYYNELDVTKKDDYQKLLGFVNEQEKAQNISQNRMFYLSVAPEFFDVIASNIKESGLGSTYGWKRLIIEKPFGHDLVSAQLLNEKLSKSFKEDEIYRIDHYLGKPMVQNIDTLRFSNPLLSGIWSNEYIANIQITASETVGLEDRAGYYDNSGALRDMVQNHMLQMLMLVAMEPPVETGDIRDEKAKVLKAIKPLTTETVLNNIVRGQYGVGMVKGKERVAYRNEKGVKENTDTETFIAARIQIENQRWQGTPFYIRAGKSMDKKSTRIVIEFKKDSEATVTANLLTIDINPNEGVKLQLNSKNNLNKDEITPIEMTFTGTTNNIPEAYERLIFDALRGDSSFFARWDEVENSWNYVQPILDAFNANFPLHIYTSGSQGPIASHELLEEDGFSWN